MWVRRLRFRRAGFALEEPPFLFFLPLPNEATITGEVVKLEPGGTPPGTGAATSAPGTSL